MVEDQEIKVSNRVKNGFHEREGEVKRSLEPLFYGIHFVFCAYFCSFSKSLISFKSLTSSGSAGGGAGFASSFFLKLLKNLTTQKRTSAVI